MKAFTKDYMHKTMLKITPLIIKRTIKDNTSNSGPAYMINFIQVSIQLTSRRTIKDSINNNGLVNILKPLLGIIQEYILYNGLSYINKPGQDYMLKHMKVNLQPPG